ncbi:MAG: tagaturonate reductase, partial [bacterium]
MIPRLNRALLDTVRRERGDVVAVPADALLDLPERAVQFGTGALLRGFIDDFVHRANVDGKFGGRIVAIASTGSARDRALREQDGLYTLVVEGIEGGQPMRECRIISSVSRALSAVDEWNDVLELAREPLLEYVFSNTTEVGIAADEDSGPDDAPPRSFPAKLTRFLFERATAFEFDQARGLTVIPCELIEGNGARLREIVVSLAKRWELGTTFTEWLDTSVPFCNTLVDRIVPGAPKGDDVERLRAMLGYEDAMLTTCEPYRLFAIEGDEALRARLTWATDSGIIITPDITPYRKRKVHLLNGAHTLLVSVALQLGYETVREAITQPALNRFVRRAMLDEIAPTLQVDGTEEFAEAVLDRF